jgi:hypothetical protein
MALSRVSRRQFLAQSASLGAALAALAAVPGPIAELLGGGGVDTAAAAELSEPKLRTFVAACEAVCSFDGRTPPPASVNGLPHPTAADAGARFAAEYGPQSAGLRQTFDLLLALVELGPVTPPPIGATSAADLLAYLPRSFSALDVPLRLRFIRSWAADFDPLPISVAGFADIGALHRGIAAALIQLSCFFFYEDPRSWPPLGYGGPWLHRPHENEELPFSHHGHGVEPVFYGPGVVA